MIDRIPRWFLIVGIVTAPIGCDNVSWGGMSFSLEPPPGDSLAPSEGESESDPSAGPERIDYGPLLYAVDRQGDSARTIPVAEIRDGELHPFPAGDTGARLARQIQEEQLQPGASLILFHQGMRVGSLIMSSAGEPTTDFCSPRAQGLGHVELLPSAMDVQRFLALEDDSGISGPGGPVSPAGPDRSHRIAALNLAGEALNELRAQWPTALQNIRQDLQVFPPAEGRALSVIATFVFRDQMDLNTAPEDAYSLLILGEPQGTGWRRSYTWYRRVGDEGKGVPRLFSTLDWDRDGEEELLLEVYGDAHRWWAALDRGAAGWVLVFQDPCGALPPPDPSASGSQGGPR